MCVTVDIKMGMNARVGVRVEYDGCYKDGCEG